MFARKYVSIISMVGAVVLLIGQSFAGGQNLPNFTLKSVDGKSVSASDFKGKVLLINFWATWCGPCKHEIPDLIKLQKRYRDKGFSVVSIALSSGSPKDIKKFAEEFGINYPVLVGNQAAISAFGPVRAVPTTFIVDRSGKIRKKIVGSRSFKEFEDTIRPLLPSGN